MISDSGSMPYESVLTITLFHCFTGIKEFSSFVIWTLPGQQIRSFHIALQIARSWDNVVQYHSATYNTATSIDIIRVKSIFYGRKIWVLLRMRQGKKAPICTTGQFTEIFFLWGGILVFGGYITGHQMVRWHQYHYGVRNGMGRMRFSVSKFLADAANGQWCQGVPQ